ALTQATGLGSTIRPVRLRVRSPVSQSGKEGSTPSRVADCGVDWRQVPARSHRPSDAGSSPAPATSLMAKHGRAAIDVGRLSRVVRTTLESRPTSSPHAKKLNDSNT